MSNINIVQLNEMEKAKATFAILDKSPEIKEVMVGYGFDDATIQVGKDKLADLDEKFTRQVVTHREGLVSTINCNRLKDEVWANYMGNVTRIRHMLKKEKDIWTKAKLNGPRQKRNIDQIFQIQHFYKVALNDPEVNAKLLAAGFTNEKLTAEALLANQYLDARIQQMELKGKSQDATAQRNEAFQSFHDWMMGFIMTCRVAYAGRLHAICKLGIVPPAHSTTKNEDEPPVVIDDTEPDLPGDTGTEPEEPVQMPGVLPLYAVSPSEFTTQSQPQPQAVPAAYCALTPEDSSHVSVDASPVVSTVPSTVPSTVEDPRTMTPSEASEVLSFAPGTTAQAPAFGSNSSNNPTMTPKLKLASGKNKNINKNKNKNKNKKNRKAA